MRGLLSRAVVTGWEERAWGGHWESDVHIVLLTGGMRAGAGRARGGGGGGRGSSWDPYSCPVLPCCSATQCPCTCLLTLAVPVLQIASLEGVVGVLGFMIRPGDKVRPGAPGMPEAGGA